MSRAGLLAILLVCTFAAPAVAVPPPPPKPSDQDIQDSRTSRDSKASEVGELTNKLAEAETRLTDLQAAVELKMEDANKALVDLDSARSAADKARADADATRREADAASAVIERIRREVDDFAAASFRQGTTVGSISAYLGATSPQDLLDRSALLNVVSASQLDVLDRIQRARVDRANKDSLARAAVNLANEKEAAAAKAKATADAATRAAEDAR